MANFNARHPACPHRSQDFARLFNMQVTCTVHDKLLWMANDALPDVGSSVPWTDLAMLGSCEALSSLAQENFEKKVAAPGSRHGDANAQNSDSPVQVMIKGRSRNVCSSRVSFLLRFCCHSLSRLARDAFQTSTVCCSCSCQQQRKSCCSAAGLGWPGSRAHSY